MIDTVSDAVICVSMNLMAASRARICSAGCMDDRSKNIAISRRSFSWSDFTGGAGSARGAAGLASAGPRRLQRRRGRFERGQRLAIQVLQFEHGDLLRLAVLEQRELILL